MSAQGKIKRGESGVSNAKHISFRYTGGGVYPDHLRRIMSAVPGLVEKCGRPRPGSAYDKEPQGLSFTEATNQENKR